MIQNIVLIGAGRLATGLGITLKERGFRILQICNRTEDNAKRLAGLLGCEYTTEFHHPVSADLYIIAVADQALPEISDKFRAGSIVVHTSGTIGMNVLSKCSDDIGVIYPPQTFTLDNPPDLSRVPLCIEANNGRSLEMLAELGSRISDKVVVADSQQRLMLHLAATIASNFPNFLYAIAENILTDAGMDPGLLVPLILETAGHARSRDVFSLQTGPAVREDGNVIDTHLELLKQYPEYRDIYQLLTTSIINHKNRNDKLQRKTD